MVSVLALSAVDHGFEPRSGQTKAAIFQLCHGANKLIFNEMMITVRFVLDQHAELNFYNASALKQ
jgi:hypothetical protein